MDLKILKIKKCSHIYMWVNRKKFSLLMPYISFNNAIKHRENSSINHVDIILDSLEHLVEDDGSHQGLFATGVVVLVIAFMIVG